MARAAGSHLSMGSKVGRHPTMRRRRLRGACAALALTLPLAIAATAHARTTAWHCELRVGGTNTEWGECTAKEVRSQENRLNRAWKKLLPLLDEKSRTDMIAEERAWAAFKDKSCVFYANGEWGREGEVVHFGYCRAAVVSKRADDLEDLIDDVARR